MSVLIPQGVLIVSCQARLDNPLHGPAFMEAMGFAAKEGGAGALRANGYADIGAVKRSGLPVIGISKLFSHDPVYITPTLAAADDVAEAGADIIALDCTFRERKGDPYADIIRHIRDDLGREVFADVSSFEEGLKAAELGATYVATTLAGYTGGPVPAAPDLDLVARLAEALSVPVVAEGRFHTPELARAAIDAGAHAVVVGTMITNPREITRGFARAVAGTP